VVWPVFGEQALGYSFSSTLGDFAVRGVKLKFFQKLIEVRVNKAEQD
jgi:hypothetical protein